ncbi:hypothetical protein [Tsuneonella sp. HG222]
MTEAFHIVALAWLAALAAIWSSKGWINIAIKVAAAGSAAWAAIVVALDYVA